MEENNDEIIEIFSETYGPENARKWFQRWRIFFMSCVCMLKNLRVFLICY